jgi:ABC-2 type transport system ATP-binding protein
VAKAVGLLGEIAVGDIQVDQRSRSINVPVNGGAAALASALRAMDGGSIDLSDIGLRRPTLDDVFLALTGHAAEPTTTEAEEATR